MKSFFEKEQDIKKVNKPWGPELWIASDLNNKTYAQKLSIWVMEFLTTTQ